ncbi:hypothetical protein JCM11251_000673 [Rhodosporidiobolus azoricus]
MEGETRNEAALAVLDLEMTKLQENFPKYNLSALGYDGKSRSYAVFIQALPNLSESTEKINQRIRDLNLAPDILSRIRSYLQARPGVEVLPALAQAASRFSTDDSMYTLPAPLFSDVSQHVRSWAQAFVEDAEVDKLLLTTTLFAEILRATIPTRDSSSYAIAFYCYTPFHDPSHRISLSYSAS